MKKSKIKSIIISQPKPESEKSPYFELAKRLGLKMDFRPFISVTPISAKEFKSQKINIADFTAIILNSRNSVDHFFRMCTELKLEMPPETKYFCVNESIANYLAKYIQVRKRKVFVGKSTEVELLNVIKNHPDEKFLFACSDWRKPDIEKFMKKNKFKYKEGFFYRIVSSDLSDLSDVNYDIICFFSPADIRSLFENFPKFKQNNTLIAAWGATTVKAITDAKLTINIMAPSAESPSMIMALEKYIEANNKGLK
ncbi:MAG: uroporphyrinogen-III synthase [Bacteroidia bacterium]|nr:uroporphyrinogen-III synthase [Bacteroidia bacterium]MCC7533500.1 uroporphyrinogen-III synthase [Bacteroidia bacterium]